MWVFNKPVEELREEDLQSLISNRVREGATLAYKRQMYGSSDSEIRKMVRDIASLANRDGGIIVIGMDEDGEGVALSLVPVPNAEGEASRIASSCLANISERIAGLRAVPILVAGGSVIVVQVPRSYRKPHMVTFQGRTEFLLRHDRQNSPMSMSEIRAALVSTEELGMRAERFMESRRRIANDRAKELQFQLTGTPLLLEEGRIETSAPDLLSLLKNPPTFRQGGVSLAVLGGRFLPTLRGVALVTDGLQSLEVFRNGHVEFSAGRSLQGDPPEYEPGELRAWAVAEYIRNFVHFLHELRNVAMITDPYLVTASLWRCGGIKTYERKAGPFATGALGEWDEGSDLLLPPIIGTLGEEPDRIAERVATRFWNAFHFRACRFFDQEGQFRFPTR